jgi:hypothetical protein
MTRQQSLASWAMAMLFMLSAILALLIYSIRKHRIDDYRGRYRVWISAAGLSIFASINATTGLWQAARSSVMRAPQAIPPVFIGSLVAIAGLCAVAIWIRLLLELRRSRAAVAAWIGVATCYLFAAGLPAEALSHVPRSLIELTREYGVMLGHWFFCMSFLAFGRYVLLDAQGKLPSVSRCGQKRGADKEAKPQTDGSWDPKNPRRTRKPKSDRNSTTIDPSVIPLSMPKSPDRGSAPAVVDKNSSANKPTSPATETASKAVSGSSGLSRADRKRLKKEQKRQNRAA